MTSISIFTPTHDSRFLPDAYASIKDQDFAEWIVVYNNGAKVLDFGDARVKTHVLPLAPEWVGPLKAYACAKATGDVLLELDHDDLLMPEAIQRTAKAFDDPAIGFVYSNTIHARLNGHGLEKVARFSETFGWKYRETEVDGVTLDEHLSFEPTPESISRIWFAPNHLRAFRRSVYEEIGGYSQSMRILDDLDLMCRLYEVTDFHHINEGLYIYRVHGENTWLRYNKEIQDNVYRIYDQYIKRLVERWAVTRSLRLIELGGRMDAREGYETVDLKEADISADLNGPWPFETNSVGVIRALDVFEHLVDPIHAMKEVSRILVPGGWLFCLVPSTDGRGAFQDPSHKSFWNENSFLYYTHRDWAKYIDTPVRFQAARLYTTEKDKRSVCWVNAHLINLKDGYRPAGLVEI